MDACPNGAKRFKSKSTGTGTQPFSSMIRAMSLIVSAEVITSHCGGRLSDLSNRSNPLRTDESGMRTSTQGAKNSSSPSTAISSSAPRFLPK